MKNKKKITKKEVKKVKVEKNACCTCGSYK